MTCLLGAACADDPSAGIVDGGDGSGGGGGVTDGGGGQDGTEDGKEDGKGGGDGDGDGNGNGNGRDGDGDVARDGARERPSDAFINADLGFTIMEPPLTVPMCPAAPTPDSACCSSALGFEDGSTMHFLTPTCCQLALSKPRLVNSPTACGRGALHLDVDFRAIDPGARCGEPGEPTACSFQTGEVSRAVLSVLDLTGRTVSAMVFLEGPPLPAGVQAALFVFGRAGLVEGVPVPLRQVRTWMRLELPFVVDGSGRGAAIRVIGVRVGGGGDAWVGHMVLDEITWR